jgi:pimeloyl-ACP methyl ester carboxylesterase
MLGKVRAPTLIVWGKQDRITPVECARIFQQSIPGAALRTIDDCGHFAHLEKPEELAAIVREFVSR